MQVNSISSSMSFRSKSLEEQFAKLGDNDLQRLAYEKAKLDTNDKKHKRIDNMLYFSLPFAAGISELAKNSYINKKELFANLKEAGYSVAQRKNLLKQLAESGNKLISPDKIRAFKSMNALGTVVSWTTMIAAFAAAWKAKFLAEKHSEKISNFSAKNPFLSWGGAFALGVGASMGIDKGIDVATKAFKGKVTYSTLRKAVKLKNALNGNKFLNAVSNTLSKVPPSAKQIGKGAVSLLPLALILTTVIHSFNHDNVKTQQANKNYNDFKVAQEEIKRVLEDDNQEEVAVENDAETDEV